MERYLRLMSCVLRTVQTLDKFLLEDFQGDQKTGKFMRFSGSHTRVSLQLTPQAISGMAWN